MIHEYLYNDYLYWLTDDGVIAADEFRYNCVTRIPVDSIDVLDEAYQNLLTVCQEYLL